jgi:hypothetical protein
VPPAWFVEGYAVYLESKLTTGGRVFDSTTRSLRRAIAREGRFPSLSDAGIGTYEDYPFGNTRYVFGAGFVAYLVNRFGEDGVRRAVRRYNQTLAFDDAWRDVHQIPLETLWNDWSLEEKRAAQIELETVNAAGLPAGVALHAGSGIPAWQTATRYAFVQGNTVRFARLDDTRELLEPRFTTLPSRPHRLSFTSDGALVYSRLVTRGATTHGELFRLAGGVERQLTTGARARDAIADGNCILYVASHLEQSTLRRRCDARDDAVYTPPEGWQLFHPTVNAQNEIALTVWRPGGFLDIAVIRPTEAMTADRVAPASPTGEGRDVRSTERRVSGRCGNATKSRCVLSSTLEFVTSDFAQDQFPTWLPDGRLVYSSDRSGIAQLWLARVGARESQPITSSAGGALGNAVSPVGALTFAGFTGVGTETRILPVWTPGQAQPLALSDPRALDNLRGEKYAIEPYQPNLLPVFWTPFTTNGPGATLVGADAAGIHVYQFSVGYDLFTGTGVNARADYSFAPALEYSLFAGAGYSQGFGWNSSLGATFTGRGESQVTGRFGYTVTPYLSLDDGAFTLGMSLRFDALALDAFGYLRFGWRWTLALDSSGGFSSALTLADLVRGQPVALAVGVSARGALEPRFTLQLQTHDSLDIHWRYPDGFVGLERLTLVPFATLEWQAGAALYGVGAQLMFDLTVNYYVPLSLGLEASWQSGNGFRFRFVTLVPLLDGLRSTP